jgi:hypothetical protein
MQELKVLLWNPKRALNVRVLGNEAFRYGQRPTSAPKIMATVWKSLRREFKEIAAMSYADSP